MYLYVYAMVQCSEICSIVLIIGKPRNLTVACFEYSPCAVRDLCIVDSVIDAVQALVSLYQCCRRSGYIIRLPGISAYGCNLVVYLKHTILICPVIVSF